MAEDAQNQVQGEFRGGALQNQAGLLTSRCPAHKSSFSKHAGRWHARSGTHRREGRVGGGRGEEGWKVAGWRLRLDDETTCEGLPLYAGSQARFPVENMSGSAARTCSAAPMGVGAPPDCKGEALERAARGREGPRHLQGWGRRERQQVRLARRAWRDAEQDYSP